jgi:glycosyltransferase involved in cell wall biosynthesis
MKVAIYTIALNERQFVDTWFEAAKDADYLMIADTGSTDGTVERARELGIHVVDVRVSPWRFDDARNAALAALPIDIDMCISLDMDEVITPNWRAPLEAAWERGVTRPRYKHIWSWNEDGTPGLEFSYDHIQFTSACMFMELKKNKSGFQKLKHITTQTQLNHALNTYHFLLFL